MLLGRIITEVQNKDKQKFFIYGAGQAFNLVTPLLILPYIVSICGEEGLGKVATGFSFALFLILIVDYSFEIKGTKKVSERRRDLIFLEEIISLTIFTKLLLFSLVVLFSVTITFLIPFFKSESSLFLFSLPIVAAQVVNPVWFLQGLEDFKKISFIMVLSKTIYVILVYGLINSSTDYIYVNLYLGLSALLVNVLVLIYSLRNKNIVLKLPPFADIFTVLKNDFSFCLSQLFLSARQLSPLVITGAFLGYTAAGKYKLIEQVITLFRTYTQVILRYFYPAVCYKIFNHKTEGFRYWKQYTGYNFILTSLLVSILFVYSDKVLMFFNASPDTVVELNMVFRVSLIIPILMSVSLSMEQLMFIADQNKAYIATAISIAIINITLIMLLVESFGISGIISSLIIAEILFILVYYKVAYRYVTNKV